MIFVIVVKAVLTVLLVGAAEVENQRTALGWNQSTLCKKSDWISAWTSGCGTGRWRGRPPRWGAARAGGPGAGVFA